VRAIVLTVAFVLFLGWLGSMAKARLRRRAPAAEVRTEADWFKLFPPTKRESLDRLKAGAAAGFLDLQDEWGMTALHLAVMSHWLDGVNVLLAARADCELRYYRTGETALTSAVREKDESIVRALLDAGANPDAGNYWGRTPRQMADATSLEALFATVPERPVALPAPRLQNAEHLAGHYPDFRIPERLERESLSAGQAVDVHVHGPKKAEVKVRIRHVEREEGKVRYTGDLELGDQESNLPPETREVTFGPEHVATIYLKRLA
jgi:hypothetical protein